ncbi:MAG TPA: type ISP restriction/modification enzyme [Candidatus Acidoferrum sp.]|nr:type ISP restriction/modification enzyme [Candidatus Acidoferrum sp.]
MLHAAPLAAPEDLAWFLASYARDALHRISLHDLPALATVRKALEEALGLAFEGEKGEHFFRSTLVQTLFYGVFSAWVLWAKQHPPTSKDRFEWTLTTRLLRVPVLRKLFHEIADPGQLENLNLAEILDWTSGVLNRVDRATFFAKFQEVHAVQYFYEPFLQAFDPELRKQLGVWYTPPEIVQYMVARVDTVLRDELNLPDGLADKNVYVLDPCCGTGSYLVEVLKKIHETLKQRGEDALLASDLKEAAQNRVFGFEILPAPFVVAHLQLGLLLQNLGAPLAEKGSERIGVYLTNALTGWEPPREPKKRLLFPELQEERDAAEHVKRSTPIIVILGNPPYNGFAGVSPEEEQGLVEPYKEGLIKDWKIKKFNLDDLYIRFFRLAERRIAEMSGRGVVCFISNHSWVSDPSFVVLRQHLLSSFDRFWVENMHGNRKISEYAPDGGTSETVFAISGFSVGIQQGVATSLWVKTGQKSKPTIVLFRDDINEAKAADRRAHLLSTLDTAPFDEAYIAANPESDNWLSFRPSTVSTQYRSWPKLVDLCAVPPMNGLMEKRGGSLMDMDKVNLEKRMRAYFDSGVEWDSLKTISPELTTNAARFDAKKTRQKVLVTQKFDADMTKRYALRPLENCWIYYSSVRPLWNEPRPTLWKQCWDTNSFLVSRFKAAKDPEGPPFYFVRGLSDDHLLTPDASCFPMQVRIGMDMQDLQRTLDTSVTTEANLSPKVRSYCKNLGHNKLDEDVVQASHVWFHVLAIGYSPAYLLENCDGIRQDWPRIPLPDSTAAFLASAELGRQVALILDADLPVKGVTTGTVRSELKPMAVTARVGGGSLREIDLALTAGWGHAGKEGVTMPGKGKLVERPYSESELDAIKQGAKALGLSEKEALAQLGESTCDVYLNDVAYWSNIPSRVWDYTIGGYQVIKKWLSYREEPLLGHPLTKDEVRYVQEMARRIAAILLLQPALDANYESSKRHAFIWPSTV